MDHGYLVHPIDLVGSITWALAVSWLLSLHSLLRPVRVVAVALVAYELVPVHPWMCSLGMSVQGVRALIRGEMPEERPLGCLHSFRSPARWEAYRAVLDYLRQATTPQTFVADVLNRFPWESLNGPAGRLSPFRTDGGIRWLSWIHIDLDAEFARDLLNSTDAVVVWEPSQDDVDPAMRLERVIAAIREHFEPEARFGDIEVWRRKPVSSAPTRDESVQSAGRINGGKRARTVPARQSSSGNIGLRMWRKVKRAGSMAVSPGVSTSMTRPAIGP